MRPIRSARREERRPNAGPPPAAPPRRRLHRRGAERPDRRSCRTAVRPHPASATRKIYGINANWDTHSWSAWYAV
ncbi:hypothetical protein GCM10009665_69620 [Kitasatospora nipponensis]|uniref:Uncharacterized protein n=1 Tax=Kitasatospora nipponensis TaxID=258049 RepID=A0ABN1WY50_9ACTN